MKTKRIDISSAIYVGMMIVIFFLSTSLKAQDFVKDEISVVEFNPSWNKKNTFKDLRELNNCCIYNINLCDNISYMKLFNIPIPSIIIFVNGEEAKRYRVNILLRFECSLKNIQEDVDSLLIARFN